MTLRDWRGGRIKKRMNVPIPFTDLGSSKCHWYLTGKLWRFKSCSSQLGDFKIANIFWNFEEDVFFIFFPVFGMLDIAVLKNEFLCSQGAAGSTVDKHYLTMVW